MEPLEVYHGIEEYNSQKASSLVAHINEYLLRTRTLPFCVAPSLFGGSMIKFTFSDHLLEYFKRNPQKLQKPFEVAVKYGFRGYSRGEQNGIFYLRNSDQDLIQQLNTLYANHRMITNSILDVDENTNLDEVKIVFHNTKGERIVGLLNKTKDLALFLGIAKYE